MTESTRVLDECHYCGIPLVDARDTETIERIGIFHPLVVDYEWCCCGLHDIAAGVPCVREASWSLPKGYDWLYRDHRTPRCRNGGDNPQNLVPTCMACNGRKGSKPYLHFILEGSHAWPEEVRKFMAPSWGLDALVRRTACA